MKIHKFGWIYGVTGLFVATAVAASAALQPVAQNQSFKNELQAAMDRGFAWLKNNQNTNGSWSQPELPALTALPLMALKGDPAGKYGANEPEWVARAYRFLLSNVKPDGGIYHTNYATYNTALGMMALLAANNPRYEPAIRAARRFLVGLQTDFGEPGKLDTPLDGGIGYGTKYKHSDMGNTLAALEACYYSRHLVQDKDPNEKDLNYAAAIHFLQNCQNLPSHNKQEWVSDDPRDLGGFVYYPGHSMAGSRTNPATGKVSLRSYGSISYAGLLSYIYARLDKSDPRVKAVLDWLRNNYTLSENPGMGPEGLYFYYHTMSKALSIAGVDVLETGGGEKVEWRRQLAMKLLNAQKPDGSWVNESNRWMEKDPVLVTCYALLSLEHIWRGL